LSRRAGWALAAVLPVSPLAVQEPVREMTAEEVVEAARKAYEIPEAAPRETCPETETIGEIVVCALPEEQSQFRIRSSSRAEAEYALATPNRGRPRAPSMGPPPCVPSLLTMCSGGGALPKATLIDLASIPEPPAGSDAERVANGELVR